MLDHHNREKFAAVYRLLADVLEHETSATRENDGVSYLLGGLAGRVFMGTPIEPPDEVLEATVQVLRMGGAAERQHLALRLRSCAQELGPGADDGTRET